MSSLHENSEKVNEHIISSFRRVYPIQHLNICAEVELCMKSGSIFGAS